MGPLLKLEFFYEINYSGSYLSHSIIIKGERLVTDNVEILYKVNFCNKAQKHQGGVNNGGKKGAKKHD